MVSTGAVGVNTAGHTSISSNLNAGTFAGIESVGSALTGFDAANYSFAGAAGNYVVNPATLTVTYTASIATRAYGTANPPLSGTASTVGLVSGDTLSGTASFTTAATTASNVGQYAITGAGLSASSNYLASFVQAAGNATAFTITPALLKAITASLTGVTSKVYNGTTVASLTPGNFTLTGFVSGQGASVNQAVGTYASANVGSGIVVTASLALANFNANAGTNLANYTLPTIATGSIGMITKAPLTLTYNATAASRIYGNANPALTGSVSAIGLVNGEALANVTTGSANFTTKATTVSNVGSFAVTGAGLTTNGNYAASVVQGAGNANALAITPRPITVTATAQSRVYGNANPVLTYTVGGLGLVDNDKLSGALATTANTQSNVGLYNINQGTLAASTNYAFTYVGNKLTVTQRPLTITYTANLVTREVGTRNPVFTGTTASSGLVNGDKLTGTALFSSSATATSVVGLYAIYGSGLGASSNYLVTQVQAPRNATALSVIRDDDSDDDNHYRH